MNDEFPPAGWYPDPVAPTGRRYWDGTGWTAATAGNIAADTGGVRSGAAPMTPQVPLSSVPGPAASRGPAANPPSGSAFPPGGARPAASPVGTGPVGSTSAPLPPSVRLSPRAWLGAGAVLLMLLLVVVRGGQTHDVAGTFEFLDDSFAYVADGTSCWGTGGYRDLRSGAPVRVRDGAGELLASGSLREGYVDGLSCVFDFDLPGVAPSDFYAFEVSHRGEVTFSRIELAASEWRVELYVGD